MPSRSRLGMTSAWQKNENYRKTITSSNYLLLPPHVPYWPNPGGETSIFIRRGYSNRGACFRYRSAPRGSGVRNVRSQAFGKTASNDGNSRKEAPQSKLIERKRLSSSDKFDFSSLMSHLPNQSRPCEMTRVSLIGPATSAPTVQGRAASGVTALARIGGRGSGAGKQIFDKLDGIAQPFYATQNISHIFLLT